MSKLTSKSPVLVWAAIVVLQYLSLTRASVTPRQLKTTTSCAPRQFCGLLSTSCLSLVGHVLPPNKTASYLSGQCLTTAERPVAAPHRVRLGGVIQVENFAFKS